MERKYFWIICIVAIIVIIVGILFYLSNESMACGLSGGQWIVKGQECNGLTQEECTKNPNCTSYMKSYGPNLPAFRFDRCGSTEICKCTTEGFEKFVGCNWKLHPRHWFD